MVTLENKKILVEIAPEVGARIVRFVHKASGYDYLWRNENVPLRLEAPGTEYDPNFYGGIDELLPNDLEETIDGIACPDHGELWTTEFQHSKHLGIEEFRDPPFPRPPGSPPALVPAAVSGDLAIPLNFSFTEVPRREGGYGFAGMLVLKATLSRFGFYVAKLIWLKGNECIVSTRIVNLSDTTKHFLFKLHAAVKIQPGDQITCDAKRYTGVDPEWSRRGGEGDWQGETIPEFDSSTEFLYLHPLRKGLMEWSNEERTFQVKFDRKIFRYCWYFASYGGFFGHHVAVLEPCTCIPKEVNEAAKLGQCSVLEPGKSLKTTYRYVAL